MQILFYGFIFILGLMFWSFSSVLITRLKTGEKGIMNGRSHCPKCNHTLSFLDLFPVFSYIFRKWKCAYCSKKISIMYPFLELVMWLFFLASSYFLIDFSLILSWNLLEIIKLFFFLFITFISLIIAVYDILYLEIQDWIILTWIIVSLIFIIIWTLDPSFNIINTLSYWGQTQFINISSILLWTSILVLLYVIIFSWLKEIYDLILIWLSISSIIAFKYYFQIEIVSSVTIIWAILWALWLFTFLYLQHFLWIVLHKIEKLRKIDEENYRFENGIIWAWDLRIAIFVWLLLWRFYTIVWWFLTYIIGSIVGIFIIILSILKWKKTTWLIVPFWPFLIFWLLFTLYFQNFIIDIVQNFFVY